MQKVTVTRVSSKEVETKFGKATKIGIQTAEHGETWFSSFTNKMNETKLKAIKEGDTIEVVTTKNGDFWNFRLASQVDRLQADVDMIKKHLNIEDTVVEDDEF